MGWVTAMSACFGCGKVFAYNPNRVPSIRHEGVKQPVCLECINLANPRRIENGLSPLVPHPEAYQPLDENELGTD